MFVVRHDIELVGTGQACACLSAFAGSADDPKIKWSVERPRINADALVFAMSGRAASCDDSRKLSGPRRPSISAVEQQGDDVVIEVEELVASKPMAEGAIIPKPGAKGGVYVRPKHQSLPYARASSGKMCRVM